MKRESLFTFVFLTVFVMSAFAGTGGSELSSVWNEISQGLQGFWGKIIAVLFIGFTLIAAKGGNILMAFAMFIVAMLIGIVPGVIDTRYTLTFI